MSGNINMIPRGIRNMDIKDWLTQDKDEMVEMSLRLHGKTEEQLKEDIQIMKDWLNVQPHLPEKPSLHKDMNRVLMTPKKFQTEMAKDLINDYEKAQKSTGDHLLMNSLLLNKFSIENTKQKLDMYYTIRHLLPEVFGALSADDMVKCTDVCYFLPLPKRTKDGDRISVVALRKDSEDNFDMYRLMCFCYNSLDMRFHEDVLTSDIIIDDLQYVRMSHIVKITPIQLKKVVMILEKVYGNRVKQFHFLNCPPYAYAVLNLLKQMMKPKLAARIFIHEGVSTITTHISKEILPSDFGGKERSLYELNELWKQKMYDYKDRFAALSKMRTNEKLRPTPLKNDEILGYHGNFKKLEMD